MSAIQRYKLMIRPISLALVAVSVVALGLSGCGRKSARLINKVKEIPMSGARDTIFMERSSYWDKGRTTTAHADSNRQFIAFRPLSGQTAYVTLQNMGGVPLRRDTIQAAVRESAEHFLRTGTADSNMHLHIEFSDWKKPATDVVIYIRNRDSVYREILFVGR